MLGDHKQDLNRDGGTRSYYVVVWVWHRTDMSGDYLEMPSLSIGLQDDGDDDDDNDNVVVKELVPYRLFK